MNQHDDLQISGNGEALSPILIAGGGIGGLTVAIALARKGIRSHILERRNKFSEAGAGIQIGPNGTQILERLGIAEALAPMAGVPDSINVFDGPSGNQLTALPLGNWISQRHGAPYWVLHRRDLQRVLLDVAVTLPEIKISTGFSVNDVSDDGISVEATSDAGSKVRGRALVGADGIWSQARRKVFNAAELQPNGMLAARAVLPAANLAPPFNGNNVGIWLMPDKHVVHYPVRGGRDIAVVLILARGNAAFANDRNHQQWDGRINAAQLGLEASSTAPALANFLTRIQNWRSWSLFDPPALPSWQQGRIALLGDAAHPVLPFLAQGAVMALEDAMVIANAIADSPANTAQAFAAYERERRARILRVQAASRQNGRIYHMTGPAKWARNAAMKVTPPTRLLQRYDWLYGWQLAQSKDTSISSAKTRDAELQSP